MICQASSGKTLLTCASHGPASAGFPCCGTGGRYRLKQVMLFRSIHPPSEIRRLGMSMGSPGAQVICSTGLYLSSHALADTGFAPLSEIGGIRALTLAAGHISRDGVKM